MASLNYERNRNIELKDKDFHLFVSYSTDNTDQVRTMIDNLEKMDIKCCNHDRDFLPGEHIIENTNSGMNRSLGTLIVLTEGFVKSNFCQFELTEALHKRIDDSYVLIPLKLEPCIVPESLRNITYIDAEDIPIDLVHEHVVKALVDRDIKKEKKDLNGVCAEIPLQPYRGKFVSLSRYRLENYSEAIQRLQTIHLNVSEKDWKKIVTMVNKSDLVKYRHIYRSASFVCTILAIVAFLLLQVITIVFLVVLLTTSTDSSHKAITPAGVVLAVCLPALILFWICSYCIGRKMFKSSSNSRDGYPNNYVYNFFIQERRRLNTKLWDEITLNVDNVQRCFIFFHKTSLVVMKFNLGPCQDLFLSKLDRVPRLLKYKTAEETKEEYTNRVFRTYLRYNIHNLKEPTTGLLVRHKTVSNAKCVCLLAEEWINDN